MVNHLTCTLFRFFIFCFFCRFHKLVTRCYAPSDEVAHRAIKAGLRFSQIKIFGLPVRPSFVKPIRPKVGSKILSFLLILFLGVSFSSFLFCPVSCGIELVSCPFLLTSLTGNWDVADALCALYF